MMIGEVILWVHVLCGVAWIGICATFVLAATVLAGEPGESYAFAVKAAPRINRLCVPVAIAMPITGIGNLFFAAHARGVALPAEFLEIVAAKVVLLAVMAFGLLGAWQAALRLHGQSQTSESESYCQANVRRMTALYGLIVVAGIVALGLGLWLSGT
jgi:hypothetical protein